MNRAGAGQLGDAMHCAQDRGSHCEGKRHQGHDDVRDKLGLNGYNTDNPNPPWGNTLGAKMADYYSDMVLAEFAKLRKGLPKLMAESGGALESKNVKDIAEENEPSPYWINDDDQVRDWVNGHSLSDLGKLSTTNKLKAIKTLMDGWIDDKDVAAIARICSSVTSKTEANAIRGGVNLLDMTSIGQRTMVRVAFTKMP